MGAGTGKQAGVVAKPEKGKASKSKAALKKPEKKAAGKARGRK